jgi:hypothetical protein
MMSLTTSATYSLSEKEEMGMMTDTTTITSIEEAIDFLKSQGFLINLVDGIYRIRKKDWGKLYWLDAETVIKQANVERLRAHGFNVIEDGSAVIVISDNDKQERTTANYSDSPTVARRYETELKKTGG